MRYKVSHSALGQFHINLEVLHFGTENPLQLPTVLFYTVSIKSQKPPIDSANTVVYLPHV